MSATISTPMRPATFFRTAWQAAREVQGAARGTGREARDWQVNLLVYNRFAPDVSPWWLAPTDKNPAYRYGKVVFRTNDDAYIKTPHMFVGLNVEKGIGGAAAPAYRSPARCRRYIMDLDGRWDWHAFADAMALGRLDATIVGAQEQARVDPTVIVAVADVICEEGRMEQDTHGFEVPRGHKHVVQYAYDVGRLSLLRQDADPPSLRLLKDAESISDLPTLAKAILSVEDIDWKWIDFYMGFHFDHAPETTTPRCWGAWEIWERACYPWKGWVWELSRY